MAAESSIEVAPLTSSERELLSYFEQHWFLHGSLPTRDSCVKAGFGGAIFDKALKSVAFKEGCERRGITTKVAIALTPEQLTAANVMLDLRDNRSQKKKLTELSITTAKWEGWLRDPNFRSYLQTRAENLLGDNLHESHLALLDRVRSGDMGAIKYFNEITGRYVPSGNEKVDVNGVLMKVLEVIQRHVKDPLALDGIARDMLLIADTSGVTARMPSIEPRAMPYILEQDTKSSVGVFEITEPTNFGSDM